MKITNVTPYVMWGGDRGTGPFSSTMWGGGAGRNWLFVKVETDVEQAVQRVKEGFTGVKGGAWYSDEYIDEKQVVPRFREAVAATREAVGADVDIMIDNHGRSRPSLAIRQIRAVEEFDLLFFQEPVPPDNVENYAPLRARAAHEAGARC